MPIRNPIQESIAARGRELSGAGRVGPMSLVPPGAVAAAPAVSAAQLVAEMQRAYALQYAALIAQSDVVTDMEAPFLCDQIGSTDRYLPLVRNRTNNPIRVQVMADFVIPGVGVKLSYAADGSDRGKVDVLAFNANGRVLSAPLILGANATLFVNTHDTNFALTSADVLRVRVFDAARLLGQLALNPPQALR